MRNKTCCRRRNASMSPLLTRMNNPVCVLRSLHLEGGNLVGIGRRRREMQRNRREDERLTEDEIARRKLGPRGVPGGEDSAKMTPQQEKEHSEGRRIRRPRC